MECNKWEESGLLFVSKELDNKQESDFKSHLSTCSFCSSELSLYTYEKAQFYTVDALSINTTPELDSKILALCNASQPTTTIGVFSSLWIRRAVLTALVFAFGAGAGGYFTFAYYHSKSDAVVAQKKIAQEKVATASISKSQPLSIAPDSQTQNNVPSLLKNNARPSNFSPNSSSEGIITVDLKKE